jgi:hypothetical protein
MRRVLAVVAAIALMSCDLPGGATAPGAGIRIINPGLGLFAVPDTTLPLTIELTQAGEGVIVAFSLDEAARAMGARLVAAPGGDEADSIAVATDADGQARAFVHFGIVAGTMAVKVSAPAVGVAEVATYVLQGEAATLVAQDVVVSIGDTAHVRWLAADASGRRVFVKPELTVAADGRLEIVSSGRVRGVMQGTSTLNLRIGNLEATGTAAVVSPGTLSARRPTGDAVFSSFGGSRFQAGPATDAGTHARLAPTGSGFAYTSGFRLRLLGGAGPLVPASVGTVGELDPWWSSDGQWIYFAADFGTGIRIWRIAPDGTGAALFGPATYSPPTRGWHRHPTVNPAGTLLAFASSSSYFTSPGIITIWSPASGVIGTIAGAHPAFAPDGSAIAFVDAQRIKLMNPDGTNIRNLTATADFADQIAWSPDGAWLVVRRVVGSSSFLAVVRIATGEVVHLPFTAGWTEPSWR